MNAATVEWLDRLPWSTPDDRRDLLESERAAALYADALRTAGIPQALAFEPVAFEVFAEMLAVVHGEPDELIEGGAIAT